MSSRQARKVRRAAERLHPSTQPPVSAARIDANRANAQFSTGPTTPEGKAKSSLNAVTTGVTGRTVLLPSDDVAAYEAHIRSFSLRFKPSGDHEHELVQSLADTQWRLNRIPALEAGIYALGHIEFASKFDDHDESLRAAMIDAHVYLTYEKQLRNLHIQESRLRRQYQSDLSELTELQSEREASKAPEQPISSKPASSTKDTDHPPAPAPVGFVFTTHVHHPPDANAEAGAFAA
jgi:hypothetical protein